MLLLLMASFCADAEFYFTIAVGISLELIIGFKAKVVFHVCFYQFEIANGRKIMF